MAENQENCNQEISNEEFTSPGNNFRQNNARFRGKKGGFANRNQQHRGQEDNMQEDLNQKKPFVDKIEHMIHQLSMNNTLELPSMDRSEKKFSNRNRIYISNISPETTKDDLKEFLKQYGEVSEVFVNTIKNFGFAKMDFHANAVKACLELDGALLKERMVRLKLSPVTHSIKVKNLVPLITSDLLHYSFSVFGEVESAKVLVDDRGKSMGQGIVDFVRKHSAIMAVQKCKEKCYFLSRSLKPVVVEPYEFVDQSVGLLDKHFNKRNPAFAQERSVGPRLSEVNSFEHEYGSRWQSLYDLYKQKEEALRIEFRLECEKLSAQMEYARFEHETEELRIQLRAREMDKERHKRQWEARERYVEEEKVRAEALIRQNHEEMQNSLKRQHDEMRRRQEEAELLQQAQNLTSILDSQECEATSSTREVNLGVIFDSYNNGPQDSLLGVHPDTNRSWNRGRGGHWVTEDSRGQRYPAKKRRF